MAYSDLTQIVLQNFQLEKWAPHPILIGVSGGPDSVALLKISAEIVANNPNVCVIVAHANHQQRAEESDEDQQFVESLCKQHRIQCEIGTLPIATNSAQEGLESALRDLRYQWFSELAHETGSRYVMTAHNQNDQTETVLFRLMRGTGIAGLAGIPAQRRLTDGVTLLRPMLNISRQEITDYLDRLEQPYRTDSSNGTSMFTRNKIRNELIPQIKANFSPQLDQRIESLSTQAEECQAYFDSISNELLETAFELQKDTITVDCDSMRNHPNLLVRNAMIFAWKQMEWPLRDMTFSKWQAVATIIKSDAQPESKLPGNIKMTRDGNSIILERIRLS